MFGITNAIGALVTLGVFLIKELAAKWGYKVALIAAVVAVYVAAWAAIGLALTATLALIPAHPIVEGARMFFPAKSACITAAAIFYGTMATLKSWDYFRLVAGVAAKIGA